MLNFLPQKNKNKIIYEYLLRLTVFLLIFIFASSIILISLFTPSIFFAKYKNESVTNQLKTLQQNRTNTGGDPATFIKSMNDLSSILSSGSTGKVMSDSDIIEKIASLKNNDINILSINLLKSSEKGGKNISISGNANTRDSLILFENSIVSDGLFNNVAFPVSDFIKSSNLEFSATLNF